MTEDTGVLLDRALTIGGIGRSQTGELSPVTKAIYAGQYARACTWKVTELGESSRIFTPEQTAQYALYLREQGYAWATADLAVRAIRWGHRVAGALVPDRLPATYVLRGGDPTAGRGCVVNDLDAPARRDPTELLAALTAVCRPDTVKGARDLCLINTLYATGLTCEQLVALDMDDVHVTPGVELPDYLIMRTVRWPELPLRHTPEPGHYATLCPACCMDKWHRALLDDDSSNASGPLFRSVDKAGNIANTHNAKGGKQTTDGRLAVKSVTSKILRPYAAEARLLDVLRSPAAALRLAGAAAAYARGELTLEQTARRAGYRPGSALLLQHLLELTAPPTREDTA